MISYGRQHIDQNDIISVTRILKSRLITQGPLVSKFEKELCKETGYKYASAVSNGTAALHLIGLSLGIPWTTSSFGDTHSVLGNLL